MFANRIALEEPDAAGLLDDAVTAIVTAQTQTPFARDLAIAEKTVKTHMSSILGKLGVQSRTQAALYAGRIGLVPLDQLGAAGAIAARGSPGDQRGSGGALGS